MPDPASPSPRAGAITDRQTRTLRKLDRQILVFTLLVPALLVTAFLCWIGAAFTGDAFVGNEITAEQKDEQDLLTAIAIISALAAPICLALAASTIRSRRRLRELLEKRAEPQADRPGETP